MYFQSEFEAPRVKREQIEDYLRGRASAQNQPPRRNGLLRLLFSALHLIGHGLVAVGRRLDRPEPTGAPEPQTLQARSV